MSTCDYFWRSEKEFQLPIFPLTWISKKIKEFRKFRRLFQPYHCHYKKNRKYYCQININAMRILSRRKVVDFPKQNSHWIVIIISVAVKENRECLIVWERLHSLSFILLIFKVRGLTVEVVRFKYWSHPVN